MEDVFETSKTAYGLVCVTVRLRETAFCAIGAILLLLNLFQVVKADSYFLLSRRSGLCFTGLAEWGLFRDDFSGSMLEQRSPVDRCCLWDTHYLCGHGLQVPQAFYS